MDMYMYVPLVFFLQMAEMYGEVMELNERLHKDIATKAKSLESMTARLRKAGIEVRVYSTNITIQPKIFTQPS